MDILAFWQFDFLRRALEAGLLIGIAAPFLGIFLVVRRYSLLSDALSHVSFLGVALALLLKIPIFFGVLFLSVSAALGMERLRSSGKILGESVVALVLSGSLALAVVLLSSLRGLNVNIMSYLFGSLSTVTHFDLLMLFAIVVLVLTFVMLRYHQLFLTALDEDLARVSGVRVLVLNATFAALTAGVVAASLQIVGALLIGALMVIPVLAALELRRGFFATLALSEVISLSSVIIGLWLSYRFDLASGGAIVLVAMGFYFFSFFGQRLFTRS
jgi:zinc transport system permease protein